MRDAGRRSRGKEKGDGLFLDEEESVEEETEGSISATHDGCARGKKMRGGREESVRFHTLLTSPRSRC